MKRNSGVLMHISSLNGDYSIGSFGKEAIEFIDFLKDCGFSYWQVLPFGLIDECNSPYKSYSAFAGNPFFIDLPSLFDDGLLTKYELQNAKQKTPYTAEFDRLKVERIKLLFECSKRVSLELRDEIVNFISKNPEIKNFCRFMALKDANNQLPWYEWTIDEFDENVNFMWQFIEYEFFYQWSRIKSYANQNGIKIIGDIPIYVSLDSCDVFSHPNLFLLDERKNPTAVAGVPPDYFCADGQLWGNPLYNWDEMAKDNYQWWADRINNQFVFFDGLRIDHFRGFESFWAVDASSKTAKNGKWLKGPGMNLINRIKSVAGEKLLIAEDLGDITKEVEQLVSDSGFPGMRVLQFAFLGSDDTPHLPHNYINNCIAYSGTHDNNTLLGFLWEQSDAERKVMLDYCDFRDSDWGKACPSLINMLFRSSAGLVILPIQDLLMYGSDTRLNRPGTADGNWLYRITKDQLLSIDKQHFLHLNHLYKRI